MKIFLGVILGLLLAIGIAGGAAYMAFGNLTDVSERDKTKDVQKTFDLAGFNEIEVGGVYELNVVVGPEYFVKLSGAPAEMARAEVSVENGELRLGQERPQRGERRWRDVGLTADISLPSLSGVSIAGVADGQITGVEAVDFSARLSGVGALDITGTCHALIARVSGVGELDASDLKCAKVDVSVSGIGEAEVYASQAVEARVRGIGSITVYGSPSSAEKDGGFLSDITIK